MKRHETLQSITNKLDKSFEQCASKLNECEQIYKNNSANRPLKDKFDDQMRQCDQDLRKMLNDCQHLKEQEHSRADSYLER